jgi:cytoplasmic FMR1 interacting protein
MQPSVEKLFALSDYVKEGIQTFCDFSTPIAHAYEAGRAVVAKELLCSSLLSLLDTLVVLDLVKSAKACLQNDFSFYKRTTQALQKKEVLDSLEAAGEDANEIKAIALNPEMQMKLHEFLSSSFLPPASPDKLLPTLVGKIKDIPHFETVIGYLLNFASTMYDDHKYILPREKWSLLRGMCVCLLTLGWYDEQSVYNEKAAKKLFSSDIDFDHLQQLLKSHPVIPLFGDMQLAPVQLLEKAPWFTRMKAEGKLLFELPAKASGKTLDDYVSEYDLSEKMAMVRDHFDRYGARLTSLLASIKPFFARGQSVPEAQAVYVKDMILTGLRFLSTWSEMVLKLVAWKYARPYQGADVSASGDAPLMYELAVLLNYSTGDKDNLVDMIGYIKGLARILKNAEQIVAPLLRTVMHREIQKVIQHVLTDNVLRSDKKARVRDKIKALQDLLGDWHGGTPPIEEPVHTKVLRWTNGVDGLRAIPERKVSSTNTQLVMMRAILQSILDDKDTLKSIEGNDEKSIRDFLHDSFFYKYLLSLSSTIDVCSDMGDLWYREYYLELSKQMAMDKDIVQFPIRMSLPWILIDHVVNSPNTARMENMLYPLDIYNDAADRALTVLRKQYIFDEVQAELNLCFDQVVFLLSERVYKYFKLQASSLQMDKRHRAMQLKHNVQNDLSGRSPWHHIPTFASSIEKICTVRNLTLLGRIIDLNNLVTQRVHKSLMKNIDAAVSKFESGGIQGIKELELLLDNIRTTHSLLSQHLELDSFESMLREVNDDISVVSFHGRTAVHALSELISDMLPNYVYNSGTRRFVRSKDSSSHPVPSQKRSNFRMQPIDLYGSPSMSKYMQQASKLFGGFFGADHADALIRVLGPNNMPLIVYQLMKNLDMKITNVLGPYIKALAKGFPDRTMPLKDLIAMRSRLGAAMFLPTAYQVFEIALKDILKYPDMKPAVFQGLRELGNGIVFMQLLDTVSRTQETSAWLQYAPFVGTDEGLQAGGSCLYRTVSAAVDRLMELHPNSTKPTWSAHISFEAVRRCAKVAESLVLESEKQLSTQYFKCVMSLLTKFVEPLREFAAADTVIDAENTLDFNRLYSAIQFLACMQGEPDELSDLDVFGHGLAWGVPAALVSNMYLGVLTALWYRRQVAAP